MFIETDNKIINTDMIRFIEKDQWFGPRFLRIYLKGNDDKRCVVREGEKGFNELLNLGGDNYEQRK